MRCLVLVTDAFGGRGGIAKYNRDFIQALCAYPSCKEVVVLPRLVIDPLSSFPKKLDFRMESAGNKLRYLCVLLKTVRQKPFDIIFCNHINLVPLLWFLRFLGMSSPAYLLIFGIEVWKPSQSLAIRCSIPLVKGVISISRFTKNKFLSWGRIGKKPVVILPGAVDVTKFKPGNKSRELLGRYGFEKKKVILTVARLAGRERYKGIDEILEVLPELSKQVADIAYLVVGEGQDKKRLEEKADALGVREYVVFAGYVSESEKADHYRLADAFVMPGQKEGFGLVYIEALACGIPIVASREDAGAEIVETLNCGVLTNPFSAQDLREGILRALRLPRGVCPKDINYFSYESFQKRLHDFLDRL